MDMETKCSCMNPKSLAPALIRWGLGLLFLVGGIAKVSMLNGFVRGYLAPTFEKTILPGWLVVPYGYVLPFVEIVIGAMLILGFCRVCMLLLAGLTLLSLAFGQILLKEYGAVANILMYLLMTSIALFMTESDGWALCGSKCKVSPSSSGTQDQKPA
jgi:thiosulfate dehydrogenase (quinone) large subunit